MRSLYSSFRTGLTTAAVLGLFACATVPNPGLDETALVIRPAGGNGASRVSYGPYTIFIPSGQTEPSGAKLSSPVDIYTPPNGIVLPGFRITAGLDPKNEIYSPLELSLGPEPLPEGTTEVEHPESEDLTTRFYESLGAASKESKEPQHLRMEIHPTD